MSRDWHYTEGLPEIPQLMTLHLQLETACALICSVLGAIWFHTCSGGPYTHLTVHPQQLIGLTGKDNSMNMMVMLFIG